MLMLFHAGMYSLGLLSQRQCVSQWNKVRISSYLKSVTESTHYAQFLNISALRKPTKRSVLMNDFFSKCWFGDWERDESVNSNSFCTEFQCPRFLTATEISGPDGTVSYDIPQSRELSINLLIVYISIFMSFSNCYWEYSCIYITQIGIWTWCMLMAH